MDKSYLRLVNKRKQLEIDNIQKCNEYTSKYGLTLTSDQINSIIESRRESLNDSGRIEFREGIISKIIQAFCDSPYISQNNYLEVLYELVDIFYIYKNETADLITDDELIEYMKKSFDGICQGDLDYLSGSVLYKMKENVLIGKSIKCIEEEDE